MGYMAFEGLLRHIEEIETLLELYPETKVIIDHFGFCKCSEPDSESWKKLLALAKFPQVFYAPKLNLVLILRSMS